MARKFKPGDPKGRWESDREPSERITEDSDRFSRDVTLYGEEIGKTPEELLEYALEKIKQYEGKVDVLLRHVPRKYEEKIKKLAKPLERARRAIEAVNILLVNRRIVDTIPERLKDES